MDYPVVIICSGLGDCQPIAQLLTHQPDLHPQNLIPISPHPPPTTAFTSAGGFDGNFKDMRVTRVENGAVEATLSVTKSLTNSYGTLHGGAASTLVDIVGTYVGWGK